jgi:cytochrome c553
MVREQGPFRTANPWRRIGWETTAAVIVVFFLLGFLVVDPAPPGERVRGTWAAICRGLGLSTGPPELAWQPPLRTPTRIAWTPATLAFIARGRVREGSFVALNCTACHGSTGVSHSGLYPTLAGMEAATIFKQLDDFRAAKRSFGVMQAIATALGPQSSADVAAYFASLRDGLASARGESQGGHSLREADPAIRLVFIGDQARGIPPCGACHGPSAFKLGAPRLAGQQSAYIERELGAFAEGTRQNDINEQMRTIASQLTAAEMHAVAVFYGSVGKTDRVAMSGRRK